MKTVLAWVMASAMQTSAAAGGAQVTLEAAFVAPPRSGAPASVAVTFTPRDPNVGVNQEPAPRLKLDPAQGVLVGPPPAPRGSPGEPPDPATTRYLEPAIPFAFPVTLKPGVAKGDHRVKASVTYFFCSKTEGWCRKGTGEVEVPVSVR